MKKVFKQVLIPTLSGLEVKDVLIEEGYIREIRDNLTGDEAINGSNQIMIPGFIDCHTHGFLGCNSESHSSKLHEMCLQYAKRGVLGFFPTIGPRTDEEYEGIFNQYRHELGNSQNLGNFIGLHLEGPFLNEKKAGAISPSRMRKIEMSALSQFLSKSYDLVKIMTIAPEMEHALNAIELLKHYQVKASLGHSNATHEEAKAGIIHGASQATHLFNAMSGLHHRDIGLAGASLLDPRVYVEVIFDGVHLSKEMNKLILKVKDIDKIIAISDGGDSCGNEYADGYQLEQGRVVRDGAVYLPNSNTLCGSTKDVYCHFKSLINDYKLSIYDAVRITSTNACEHFGLNMGKIEANYEANMLLINQDSLIIEQVYLKGNRINFGG